MCHALSWPIACSSNDKHQRICHFHAAQVHPPSLHLNYLQYLSALFPLACATTVYPPFPTAVFPTRTMTKHHENVHANEILMPSLYVYHLHCFLILLYMACATVIGHWFRSLPWPALAQKTGHQNVHATEITDHHSHRIPCTASIISDT